MVKPRKTQQYQGSPRRGLRKTVLISSQARYDHFDTCPDADPIGAESRAKMERNYDTMLFAALQH